MNPRPPGYEPGELPDCSTPRRMLQPSVPRADTLANPGSVRQLRFWPTLRPSASESGKRDSNPRPQPWQGCALPTELFPRSGENFSARPAAAQRPTLGRARLKGASGGEGDRTPDLVNAIHALSQLSYAPEVHAAESDTTVSAGNRETYQWVYAKSSK